MILRMLIWTMTFDDRKYIKKYNDLIESINFNFCSNHDGSFFLILQIGNVRVGNYNFDPNVSFLLGMVC